MKNKYLVIGLVSMVALSTAACGKVIQPGDVGVKIKTVGSGSGVDSKPYTTGWNMTGFGERFVEYPVITRPYSYARDKDATNHDANEEISFSDNNALPMTADVQITLAVQPAFAPKLYTTYRSSFDDMITGQIRNDVRSAIAAETEKVPVEFLYKGGRQEVIKKAMTTVATKWEPQGIHISNLEWIGNIRYPDVILQSIQTKTKADADAAAAQAQLAVTDAQAKIAIAKAEGKSQAIRLRAAALAASPAVIEEIYANKSKGLCPPGTKTCIIGQSAQALISAEKE